VQHFAAPASAPSRVRVELEAAASPLDSTKWLLRVSVDAPPDVEPVITLLFGQAVADYRPHTNLVKANVTALYELDFTPLAKREDVIATVTANGVTSAIRLGSLRSWASASPRTKRATLAAAWVRTLQSHGRSDAIIAKAREQHLDDLADLAARVDGNR
jgi:hypothetical protein